MATITDNGSTKAQILVVDDEEGVRELLGDALRVAGYSVRGASDGIVEAICTAVEHAGGDISKVVAVFGPSICGRCYVVDEERRTAVLSTLPESGDVSAHGVDIAAGLAAALADRGVSVSTVGSCTYEDKSWFSHRRDGITGRQAAAVVLL